ncbi:hypothetical protein ABZ858_05355 [Streptomyces sp. NPDC047017]|uniref:hypothetical protein n=1 Tax=Streptomyces sp. NPDC047017 TaxID=3155024 RepID=UPI00340EAFFA
MPVRHLFTLPRRDGPGPRFLAAHEAVVPGGVRPRADDISWHGLLSATELERTLGAWPFTPDSHEAHRRHPAFGPV